MQFTCGHTAVSEPSNMGRGSARVGRLAVYFNRPCLECALVRATAHRASLTNTSGVLLTDLAKTDAGIAELVASKLASTLASVRRSY